MALAGLGTPEAKPCRALIAKMIKEESPLTDLKRLGLGEPPAQDAELEIFENWLEAKRGRGKHKSVVVVGELLEPMTILLAIYKMPEAKVIGLRTLPVTKTCRLPPRPRILTVRWFGTVLRDARGVPPKEDLVAANGTPIVEVPPPSPPVEKPPEPADEPELPVEDAAPIEPDPPIRPAPEPIAKPLPAPILEIDPWIWVEAGLHLASRSFRYDSPQTANLREHRFDLVPLPSIALELTPGRPLGGPKATDALRVFAGYRRAFGLTSERIEGGAKHPTQFTDLELGARYSFQVEGMGRLVEIAPRAAFRYSEVRLGAADDGTEEALLPDVAYPSVEAGLQIGVPIRSNIHLDAAGSYLLVLGRGPSLDQPDYFPRGSAYGFDFRAGFGVRLLRELDFRLGASYAAYLMSFEAQSGATRVARGASDERMSVSIGLRYRLE